MGPPNNQACSAILFACPVAGQGLLANRRPGVSGTRVVMPAYATGRATGRRWPMRAALRLLRLARSSYAEESGMSRGNETAVSGAYAPNTGFPLSCA